VYEDKVFKPAVHCNEKGLPLSLKITVEIQLRQSIFLLGNLDDGHKCGNV